MSELATKQMLAGAIALLILLSAGCTTVVRENIISSVNTGIGVSLAENPKTEMYEVKVGYIRSQFYSVPTGKMVEGATNNAANLTPELVSGIKMNSDARHLFLGITVAENFAVGKVAVMSPAAVAMYVADAKSPEAAKRASEAAGNLSYNTPENVKGRASLDDLLKKRLKSDATCGGKTADKFANTEEFADCLADEIAPGKTLGFVRLVGGKDLDTLITKLQAAVQP